MNFNSIEFAIFLPIVFLLYWFVKKGVLQIQNIILLLSSYFFYACWDWRFLFLLIFSTLLDYFTGIKIFEASNKKNKLAWLWLSVAVNLGFLGVFKYYNFFSTSFAALFEQFGLQSNFGSLNIILPVGISFYTFHGLSYVFDLYRNRIVPERNFINYSVFVSFFPLLVAGPIERATHLLPQIVKKRSFDYQKSVEGLQQILWGLFKKIVVADNCAEMANQIFNSNSPLSGSVLILGAIFFSFQIYGDFSGYSDIAIGTAKLFGIDLIRNFNLPYFARDIADFWRRWHISLTSWFRDYLYIPLGGSKVSKPKVIRNTLIIFVVSGFWHGANLTFIVWGLYHVLLFLPLILLNKNKKHYNLNESSNWPGLKVLSQMIFTFMLTSIGWIIFRSKNLPDAINYIQSIFTYSSDYFNLSSIYSGQGAISNYSILFASISIIVLLIVEWTQRNKSHVLAISTKKYSWFVYLIVCISIFVCKGGSSAFIYFQF